MPVAQLAATQCLSPAAGCRAHRLAHAQGDVHAGQWHKRHSQEGHHTCSATDPHDMNVWSPPLSRAPNAFT